jgi:ATP-dependent protease HslVU (ClpYQ) peptidase subunit
MRLAGAKEKTMSVHMENNGKVTLCNSKVNRVTRQTKNGREVTCRGCKAAMAASVAEAEKIRKEVEAAEQKRRGVMMQKAHAFIKVMHTDENYHWRHALRVMLGENVTFAGEAVYEFVNSVARYLGRVNESLDGITRQVADVRRELDNIGIYNVYTSEAENTARRANDLLVNMGLLAATMSAPNMLMLGEILVNAGWTKPEDKKEER